MSTELFIALVANYIVLLYTCKCAFILLVDSKYCHSNAAISMHFQSIKIENSVHKILFFQGFKKWHAVIASPVSMSEA